MFIDCGGAALSAPHGRIWRIPKDCQTSKEMGDVSFVSSRSWIHIKIQYTLDYIYRFLILNICEELHVHA